MANRNRNDFLSFLDSPDQDSFSQPEKNTEGKMSRNDFMFFLQSSPVEDVDKPISKRKSFSDSLDVMNVEEEIDKVGNEISDNFDFRNVQSSVQGIINTIYKRADRNIQAEIDKTPDAEIKEPVEATLDQAMSRLKSFGQGVSSLVKGVGGGLSALGGAIADEDKEDEVNFRNVVGEGLKFWGKKASDYSKTMDDFYEITDRERDFADDVLAGVGTMSGFLVPGLTIPKLLGASGTLATIGGASVASVLESFIESGNAYESMKGKGESDKEAQKSAGKSFGLNMLLTLPTNLLGGFFGETGKKTAKNAFKKVFGVLKGAFAEGAQEGVQEVIGAYAEKELPETPEELQKFIKQTLRASGVGAIIGGGVTTIETLSDKIEQSKLAKQPEAEIKPEDVQESLSDPEVKADIPQEETIKKAEKAETAPITTEDVAETLSEPEISVSEKKVKNEVNKEVKPEFKEKTKSIIDKMDVDLGDTLLEISDPKSKADDTIEIQRLYIPKKDQRKGLGSNIIKEIFNTNPYLKAIEVLPGGKSTPFWLKQKPSKVLEDGTFRITRESFEKKLPKTSTPKQEAIKIPVADKPKIKPTPKEGVKSFEDIQIEKEPVVKKPEKEPEITEKTTDEEAVEIQEMSAKKWKKKMPSEAQREETINKSEIINNVKKSFKIPVRGKLTSRWRKSVMGTYNRAQQLVRLRTWGELEPLTHEVAHHIDRQQLKKDRKWREAFESELKELDYDPSKKRSSEGIAEFMRYYLTTNEAQAKAPKFYKYFTEKFLPANKDLQKNIDKLKQQMDIWYEQGAKNRILASIDMKGEHTKDLDISSRLKKLKRKLTDDWINEFSTMENIVSELEGKKKKDLRPSEDPREFLNMYKSKSGVMARTFVMDKAVNLKGEVVGKGLRDIISKISPDQMNEFIMYAVAKRANLLESRGKESGLDKEDISYVLEKYQNKDWDNAVDEITDWSSNLMNLLVEAGGLSSEEANVIRELNPIYLPFKRAFAEGEVNLRGGAGSFGAQGKGIKRLKGSGRAIINPIESLIQSASEIVNKAQKIHVARLFADLSEIEGAGEYIAKIPPPLNVTKITPGMFKQQLKQLTDIYNMDPKKLDNIEIDEVINVFTQGTQYQGKDNVISIWRDGQREFYEVHPDLYRALMGMDAVKRGPVLKLLSPFSRMLRLGATGLKASFGLVRNPFRDALFYTVTSKSNKATPLDIPVGVWKDISAKEGSLVWKYKKLGGEMSSMMGFDREATMKVYDELLNSQLSKKGKTLKAISDPRIWIDNFRKLLSVTEMASRTVELERSYKRYLKENPNWTEYDAFVKAFNDAQDVTLNFTRSGRYSKKVNEAVAFFNASVQGMSKIVRTFEERPIQATVKGISVLTTLALAQWWKNKDKDWYENLPLAYKYTNLFYEVGEQIVRLPIPFEIGMLFMSMPIIAMDMIKNKSSKEAKVLYELVQNIIPDITPTAFKPIIDVWRNKNFMNAPIESKGEQYKYHTERYKAYTSTLAKSLSKGLDKIGVKVSPIQLDYLANAYTGGLFRQFKFRDILTPADAPVLGDLLVNMPKNPRRQLNEFFSEYETLSQKDAIDSLEKGDKKKLARLKLKYKVLLNRNTGLLRRASKYKKVKDLDKLNKVYDKIKEILEK